MPWTHSSDIKGLCAPKIYTANGHNDIVTCFAYSQSTRRFASVGTKATILEKYPDTEIRFLDANMTILPGLYDSHGHIMLYGAMLESVNLFGTRSIEG